MFVLQVNLHFTFTRSKYPIIVVIRLMPLIAILLYLIEAGHRPPRHDVACPRREGGVVGLVVEVCGTDQVVRELGVFLFGLDLKHG